jgi:signal transduction histidine kinase
MARRVLMVAAAGLGITAGASLVAAVAGTSIDRSVSLTALVALLGLVATASAAVVAGVDQRGRRQVDLMNARLLEREQDLIRSNSELERFATIAAHDLQEPLRAILTFTSLIERRFGAGMEGEALDYLLRVSAAGQRMRALIESLLVYARIGQVERQFTVVDLNECVAEAEANVEGLILATEAEIDVGPLPTVRGNAEALTQLFTNLLSNALKYRLGRPRVTIRAQRRQHTWVISVADNGKGIDPANHEKIFELFRRLEPGDGPRGTGLGLAICARVAELHGGGISVRSTVGQGATFSVSIPLTAERPREGDRRRRRREAV